MIRLAFFALGVLTLLLHPNQGWAQTTCESCNLSFVAESLPPIELACSEGDPLDALPNFPAFQSDCANGYWTSIFKYTTGNASSCSAVRAVGLPAPLGSMQLGEFTSTGLVASNQFNDLGEALTWTVYPENVARLHGTIYNVSDVNAQFEVDFYFHQSVSGAAWLEGGGNLNDVMVEPEDVEAWSVWQLRPNISKLIGAGALEGQVVYLNNANAIQSYPFQIGMGANGVNTALGLGGTFDWSTCVGGTIFGGDGVSAFDFSSCEEHTATCASDKDAVVEFFLGNLHGYDQIQGTVNVTDDTPPVLHDLPTDYTLNCPLDLEELDGLNTVTATDDCSAVTLDMTETFVNGDCPSEFSRTRVYTATDGCGQTTQHTQVVQVVDEVSPELSIPPNATFDCDAGPTFAPATASDACDGILDVVEGEQVFEEGDCPGEYTIYRTFSTTDLCGNVTTGAQTISVRDQTPPVLAMPEDVVLPCGSNFVYPQATATDNCTDAEDITISVFNSLPPTSCPEEYVLERRFLATDLCGNSVLELQTVTVTDTDLPYFTFVPEDASYACDETPVLEAATAADDCSSFEVVTTMDTVFMECAANYDLVRTFVVTDACGNMAEAQQVISVRDVEAPVISSGFEDQIALECDQIWSPTDLDATDNCSPVAWEMIVDTIGMPSTGVFQLTATHVASDACGNASTVVQTVSFSDSTPPTFASVPADLTVSCEEDVPFQSAEALDNCSSVTMEVIDNLSPEYIEGIRLLTRTFVATDAQGNVAEAEQWISIVDDAAPEFTFIPAGYTVECSDEMPMEDATASDNCGEVTIEVSGETTAGDAAGNYVIVRTFTATDDAGNSSSATQTITVQDTTAPEFTFVPEDATVECDEEWPQAMATASDACGTVNVEVVTDTLPGECGLMVVQHLFTATDDAGNVATATQTVTQVDTQAPTFTDFVEEVNLSCTQAFDQIPIPGVEDECAADLTLTWNDVEFSGGCTLPISAVIRTYTAVDGCNNVSQAEQVIQLTDNEAPEWLSLPEDVTIECTETYELVLPTATDNCASPVITWETDTIGEVATGVYDLVFSFSAVDDCDNLAQHEHIVHVEDTTEPSWLTFPANQVIACGEPLDASLPTAVDACSETVAIDLVSESFSEGTCEGSGLWTRTFSATDLNGNVLEASQFIEVVDTVAPYFVLVPDAVTVECNEELPVTMAEAADECGTTVVTVSDDLVEGINENNYTVIRTFTATDACGNQADAVQIISVMDTTPPTFLDVLSEEIRQCGEDLAPLSVETEDYCSDSVSVTVHDVNTPGVCEGTFNIARTYVISDISGNTDSMLVTIQVVDTLAPEWTFAPEDVTLSCDASLPADSAMAVDGCSDVMVQLETDTLFGNALGNYDIVQTWTAQDACGNAVVHERLIQVIDTVAPTVVFPEDTVISCTSELPNWTPLIADNCGTTSWTQEDAFTPGTCNGSGTWTRVYTVSDDAGNTTEGVQLISVVDDEAPEFMFVPGPATWECNAPAVLDSATATDGCSEVVLVAEIDTLDAGGVTPWTLMVIWTAEDVCGNTAQATQEITVVDQLSPVIQEGPDTTNLAWGDSLLLDLWQEELVYNDGCSDLEDLTVSVAVDTLDASEPCVDELVLTWTVEDEVGNQANWLQSVQLLDLDAPEWSNSPMDLLLPCDSVWEPLAPSWTDHNDFEVVQTLDTVSGACPSEMTLTWTLIATDVCGNASEPWIQVVTMVDTLAPELLSWPEDVVVNAPSDVPACDVELIVWADNCSDALVDCVTDTLEQYCPGSYLLGRTYSVTDACGNASTVQQNILVEDVEAPVFEDLPNELTYECDTTLSPPSIGELTITDNQSTMDDILADVLELDSEGDDCSSFTTFRYTAMDGCGNMTEVFYTQIREDNGAPVLTTPLEDVEFTCLGEVPSFDDQVFLLDVEDCQSPADGGSGYEVGLVATAVDEFEGGDCTGPDCLLTRTITVDDNCGNVAMFEQVIVVSEPPTVPDLPSGFSPNNDSFNDVYQVRNAGPDLGIPPCDWLENTTFTVFDRWGSVVFLSNDISQPWDGTNLNGRPLPVGTYFVVFEANGLSYRQTVDLRR